MLDLWWVLPALILLSLLKTPWFKGVAGEWLVKLQATLRLPEGTYHPIHNVTLPTPDGSTQIDHIFVSRFGVFVVETKHMKGWIFGGANQAQWTQKIYRKSFKFQNPLHQNYKHIKALESLLDAPPDVIHSVVVFTGDSTFKSSMPANVTSGGGYISYIKSFSQRVMTEAEVAQVVSQIHSGRLAANWHTHRQHVRQLRTQPDARVERKCPRCGNKMVQRTAKRGPNAGNPFWGCSTYPKCRAVENIGST
ncbi:uncharacterized protein HMF8227_01092 [Saliniradius amylolyticus]|uniref:NERD domain-containing protein n=1 Tax=Saliniradius amylolyticus TaxID=2183582 RepID=A0A2S2E1R3_9ALTE|nr:NERD domain-containing protein [Saliniradius amylolyticus]AWL11578.1 uncharacterized protein HMF8227_01092 [Saliniradius amylolyticus]